MTPPPRCTRRNRGGSTQISSTVSRTPSPATSQPRRTPGRTRDALIDLLAPAPPKEAHYDNGLDSYFGNQCADTQYPRSLAAFKDTDRFAAAGSRFGPYWWWGNAGCAHWPVADDRFVGPWSARTSAPVLVVGNFFDGVTDYAGAQASAAAAEEQPAAQLRGVRPHRLRPERVRARLRPCLLHRRHPSPVGTVCPAPPNPFQPAALRTAAASPLPAVGLPPEWLLHR